VSVTAADAAISRDAYTMSHWLSVVDTRYQRSRRINAGWLSCCYSRQATRQWPPLCAPLWV